MTDKKSVFPDGYCEIDQIQLGNIYFGKLWFGCYDAKTTSKIQPVIGDWCFNEKLCILFFKICCQQLISKSMMTCTTLTDTHCEMSIGSSSIYAGSNICNCKMHLCSEKLCIFTETYFSALAQFARIPSLFVFVLSLYRQSSARCVSSWANFILPTPPLRVDSYWRLCCF